MFFVRFAVSLMLVVTSFVAAASSEESNPYEMFGYLKPGMYVGLQRLAGTATVSINVYSDGQEGNLVVARSLQAVGPKGVDADEFAASHPAVRKQLDELKKEPADQTLQLRVLGLRDISIGRIAAVGTDHLLIELDDRSKRRLLPKAAIGYIDLDSDPVTFFLSRREIPTGNDG